MGTLYIDRRDAVLDYKDGQLILREPCGSPKGFPSQGIDRLIIVGNVSLQSRVLTQLAANGTSVLLLEGRGYRRHALVGGPSHGDAARRLGQYQLCTSPQHCLRWAQLLVHARAAALARFYRRAAQNRPDLRLPLTTAQRQLASKLPLIRATATLDSLRGLEGSIAAIHFAAYSHLFADGLGFTHRNRRPPKDPVNAALSLGYTLTHAEAVRACQTHGLDPMLGTLHQPAYGRQSLASDLNELARQPIEQLVWRLFAEKHLRAEHFEAQDGGVLMNKTARQHFYAAYEAQAHSPKQKLHSAARAFARHCQALAP